MRFTKPPLSIADQIIRLKQRGLRISDEKFAESYLSHVSYYRLRAYTYPFQNNNDDKHQFIVPISFEDIVALYAFDQKLRAFAFEALERIEIALRTRIIYQWAIKHGSHWHVDPSLYRDPLRFSHHIDSLQKEILRSDETFIKHYKDNYTSPVTPPSWMSLEVSSFGLLSQLFHNLKKSQEKKEVTKYFGLSDSSILENWMYCFSNLRNNCAHHCRLWNRRFTAHIKIPYNTVNPFLRSKGLYPYKLYAIFACMQYILNIINPENTFKQKLKKLINDYPLKQGKEMGFIKNWENEQFWI